MSTTKRHNKNSTHLSEVAGVVASVHELIKTRPDRAVSGFAPSGKVSTHQFGTNHSLFRGRGMEFDESRVYQAGDDNRSIDWRVTARTGTVHTKLFREERERPVYIVVDCRRMMQFGSRVRFKSVLAAHIAAMLSWVGIDGGDRIGGYLLGSSGLQSFPASRNRNAMLSFLHAISDATAEPLKERQRTQGDFDTADSVDSEVSLQQALRRLRRLCRPGSLVFVISDFSDLDEDAGAELKRLSVHAHVTNVMVHDPLDSLLPGRGDFRISDGANVLSLGQLTTEQRTSHRQAFTRRCEALEALSRQRSMAYVSVSTGDDPHCVLHPHRKQRSRSARKPLGKHPEFSVAGTRASAVGNASSAVGQTRRASA